ncbi:hypothetical protein ACHAWF_006309 [Thalassiosira exigua]
MNAMNCINKPILANNGIQHSSVNQKAKRGPRGGIYDPFPVKFHRMLDQIRDEGHSDIVSWLSHGRAFKIHQPKEFAATIMPRFFNQSKYTSFQRQLNLYGFSRCCRGRDSGAYHHPFFLRNKLSLAKNIVRTKIKGNGHKTMRLDHEVDPDFYAMPSLDEEASSIDVHLISSTRSPTPVQTQVQPTVMAAPKSPSPTVVSVDSSASLSRESPVPAHPATSFMAALSQGGTSTSDFVDDLNQSIFIHELAMGCTILCQLRRDTSV